MDIQGVYPSQAVKIVAALTEAGLHASYVKQSSHGAGLMAGRVHVEVEPGQEQEAWRIANDAATAPAPAPAESSGTSAAADRAQVPGPRRGRTDAAPRPHVDR